MDAQLAAPDAEVSQGTHHLGTSGKEEMMHDEPLPLPVALRNDEITEADFLVLAQKAAEAVASVEAPVPAPRKIALGKRHPVEA